MKKAKHILGCNWKECFDGVCLCPCHSKRHREEANAIIGHLAKSIETAEDSRILREMSGVPPFCTTCSGRHNGSCHEEIPR